MKKTLFAVIIIVVIVIAGAWYFVAHPAAPATTGQTAPSAPIATVVYACNGAKSIQAAFFEGTSTPAATPAEPPTPGGSAQLTLSDGTTMTLAQTISADGARYANADESFVFWSKGNGALVLQNNQEKDYKGCIAVANVPAGENLPQVYANSGAGFSIRLPSLAAATSTDASSFKVDESYHYQELGPGKDIAGIKFTIPEAMATGTNLSDDSYVSVEEIPKAASCSANLFLDAANGAKAKTLTDNGTDYSFASSSGAGAGNRYEESVYALPGTNPCIAVRYFIHYGAIENYPAGMVKEFDKNALMSEFDAIRRTLVVNQ